MLRAGLIACCMSCAGCSYAFVQTVPAGHPPNAPVDCTSSRLAPVADGLAAIEMVGMALAVEVLSNVSFTGHGDPGGTTTAGRIVEVVALGLAGVEVASAAYGIRKTSECRRAEERWQFQVGPRPRRPGCSSDADCKSGRLCTLGACRWLRPAQRAGAIQSS